MIVVDILAAMRQVRDQLQAGGLRATINLDQVNTPAVWVTLDRLDDFTGCGAEAYLALYVVVADQAEELALAALQPQLDLLLATLDAHGLPYAIEPITATRVASSAVGPELPAYRVLTSVSV